MSEERVRPRRPAMLDPRDADALPGEIDPALRGEIGHTTANALVHGGRASEDPEVVERLIHLVENEGLDTIAAIWADAAPHTLPGALWRLYVLREGVRRDPTTVAARFALGSQRAEVASAVAGVATPPGPADVAATVDDVLSGLFTGDLAVALERAAAFCRVLATGGVLDADLVTDEREAARLTHGAHGLTQTADDLDACAALWRQGSLE